MSCAACPPKSGCLLLGIIVFAAMLGTAAALCPTAEHLQHPRYQRSHLNGPENAPVIDVAAFHAGETSRG